MENKTIGKHVIAEAYECKFSLLDNLEEMIEVFKKATKEAKMNLLNISYHKFEPQGLTVLALLSESHLSIHTFPELGYASIDCYTCGNEGDPQKAVEVIFDYIKPNRQKVITIDRGVDL